MDRQERIEAVGEQVSDCVNRLLKEYDMTLTEMIGILEVIKINWMIESIKEEGEHG